MLIDKSHSQLKELLDERKDAFQKKRINYIPPATEEKIAIKTKTVDKAVDKPSEKIETVSNDTIVKEKVETKVEQKLELKEEVNEEIKDKTENKEVLKEEATKKNISNKEIKTFSQRMKGGFFGNRR